MKTKTFLVFSTSVFVISTFLIVFHSQPPQSFQNIVTQTHQHIKDFQDNLRDVEESNLIDEERYFKLLGLDGQTEQWHNTTVPALVTYARGDDHALAVNFVQAHAHLPYTILLYNLGLKPYSLSVISNYCNSSKCAIIDFDLEEFPPHVRDDSIHAFRPLIIQHALARVGGVVWAGSGWEVARGAGCAAWWAAARAAGALAWPAAVGGAAGAAGGRRAAVTAVTHPRMFHYLRAALDDFLFVQMVDAERLVLARPRADHVMRPWVQCALTLDCIMPIGAQSEGCRFDKKPQYRYSGCHGQDASALSIILGLRWRFEEARYTAAPPAGWRRVSAAAARARLARLADAPAAATPAALAAPAARANTSRTAPPLTPHQHTHNTDQH